LNPDRFDGSFARSAPPAGGGKYFSPVTIPKFAAIGGSFCEAFVDKSGSAQFIVKKSRDPVGRFCESFVDKPSYGVTTSCGPLAARIFVLQICVASKTPSVAREGTVTKAPSRFIQTCHRSDFRVAATQSVSSF
jgi:hypothetical protein